MARRFSKAACIAVALIGADCRCKAPPDPSPQITTNLVIEDAAASDVVGTPPAAVARCADPKKIVVVGTVPERLRWMRDVLTDDTSEWDLATLAKKPLVVPPGPTDDAAAKPSHGRRTLRPIPGGVIVLDSSGKEIFRHRGCTSDIGIPEPYALSETGAFLECWRDRNSRLVFGIDDPARRSVRLDAQWDDVSPDETYVVGVPISALARTTIEHHAVLESPKTISTDVDPPDWHRHAKVSFCGTGRLFAVYAAHPKQRPSHVLVFRGSDGAFLGSAPIAGSSDPEWESYLDFNGAGTHMILLQTAPGAAATTVLFRLER